jgi:hypothetical protein
MLFELNDSGSAFYRIEFRLWSVEAQRDRAHFAVSTSTVAKSSRDITRRNEDNPGTSCS